MAKYKRYQGEFIAVDGVRWRAEIWQEADKAFASVGALEFDADEPLTIEWSRRAKEEVICGATATLKIVSPGDRTYADMYSVDVNRVRLDVYRNGLLYWSGAMDTEFYEEPYEQLNGYVVSLTFTDFGVWDRLKYDLAGLQTIGDIIDNAITRAGFMCGGVDSSLISTKLDATTALTLNSIKVNSGNFFDEDGEASTLAEVIAGVLQPLALRIVQRAGVLRVYDLNALYNNAARKPIEWDGDSQTMSVDSVYNNAKVTWSPYAQGGELLPDTCWPEDIKTPAYLTALNNLNGVTADGATYYSYRNTNNQAEWDDRTGVGFTLWVTAEGDNIELVDTTSRRFKIVPQLDGSEAEGVAVKWTAVESLVNNARIRTYGTATPLSYPSVGGVAFRSAKVWLPPVDNPSELLVKIKLESLIDVRINPFEEARNIDNTYGDLELDDKTYAEQLKKYGNFVYVPVRVYYQPDNSDTLYTWSNRNVITYKPAAGGFYITTLERTLGEWVDSRNDHGYVAYYADDRESDTGVMGWQPNRPATPPRAGSYHADLSSAEGQYIPYPTYGPGKLWVEVIGSGWQIIDAGDELATAENGKKGLHNRIKWALFKCPEIEVVNNRQFEPEIESDDVEYSAELNAAAKEEIALDTICGTSAEGVPTARGAYYRANNNEQIKTLTRADRTTQAEDLLIGTLYSQYAQRRTMLSGETTLLANAVAAYTEANQEGKVFIALEDLQDLRAGTSDATFVELRPDEYKRNNE